MANEPQNDRNAIRWLPVRSRAKAAQQVQTVTIGGGPTGGTFTLTYDGQTTGGIAYNAAAAAVQTALTALSTVGGGNVTVGGGAGGPYAVTFGGTIGGTAKPLTASGAGLTPSGSVTPTAAGEGDAPPYAVLMVTGTDSADGSILINRPNADGISPALLLLNGESLLPAGQDGYGNAASPALALYETGDGTPSVADISWGSGVDTWKLKKDKAGFKIHGNPDGGVVLVAREAGGCLAPGGVGGTVTDHVTTVGTDCTTNQDIQTDWYFGCPIRVVTSVLGPADCCTTTIAVAGVSGQVQVQLNGGAWGASAAATDGDAVAFRVDPEYATQVALAGQVYGF